MKGTPTGEDVARRVAKKAAGSAVKKILISVIAANFSVLFVILGVALAVTILVAVLGSAAGASCQVSTGADVEPSEEALSDIPSNYLKLYQGSAEKYGLDWAILAAVGKIETDHGRLDAPGVTSGQNQNGCCAGPMQFNNNFGKGGGTWDAYKVDGDGDGDTDIYDPADAIYTAGRMLKAKGARLMSSLAAEGCRLGP